VRKEISRTDNKINQLVKLVLVLYLNQVRIQDS